MARDWMKTAREKAGKTQAVLASELHISESYYCDIDNGKRMPRLDIHFANTLSSLLKVPLRRILDYESDYKPENVP